MRSLLSLLVFASVTGASTLWADSQAFFGVKMAVEAETVQGAEVVASVRPFTPDYQESHGDADGKIETSRLETPQGAAVFLKGRTRLANGVFVGEAEATPAGLANFGVYGDVQITFKNWGGATATVALVLETGGDLASNVDGSNALDRGNAYTRIRLWNRTSGVDVFDDRIEADAVPASPEAKANADFSKRHLFRLRPGQEILFELATTNFAIASSGDVDSLFDE